MENKVKKLHNINLESRAKTSMTGIEKVITSAPDELNLLSSEGGLKINGKELKIEHFSLTEGTLTFTGTVDAIKYTVAKAPLFKRLFK